MRAFRPDRLSVAAKTIENFVARAIRLYEQEPGEPWGSSRFGLYVRRWVRWTGLGFISTVKRFRSVWSGHGPQSRNPMEKEDSLPLNPMAPD